MLCLRSQFVHEDLNPDLPVPSCTLHSISTIPNQPWKYLGLFPSNCSLTLDGYLPPPFLSPPPLTSQMLGQSGAPAPQAPGTGSALAALTTMSALLVFLEKRKKKKIQVALEAILSHHPLLFTIPSLETSNLLSEHLLPLLLPVTGRPCGLFNVTNGPKTYIQEHH